MTAIAFNAVHNVVVSGDQKGVLEYWSPDDGVPLPAQHNAADYARLRFRHVDAALLPLPLLRFWGLLRVDTSRWLSEEGVTPCAAVAQPQVQD